MDKTNHIEKLKNQIKQSNVPQELKEMVLNRLNQLVVLMESAYFLPELDRFVKYIDWITSLPWDERTKDILDLNHAKQVLDESHFGLSQIKDRVLEYISVMKLKQDRGEGSDVFRAPILCFVGLVGTGKTSISKSIAQALGRKYARIPFGGMGSPLDLRGLSRTQAEAEPGKIIKALRQTESKNPVVLLDEIDRVTDEGRASIMGVLVELLDPEQNYAYTDHYIDYPVDLSEILFIATANNTNNISTAVLDRLEPISMPSYSDQEKIVIARDYMLPKILKNSGIDASLIELSDQTWAQITRPLGFDAGIRTLERTIEGVIRKIAREIVEGNKGPFNITPESVKKYLPQF